MRLRLALTELKNQCSFCHAKICSVFSQIASGKCHSIINEITNTKSLLIVTAERYEIEEYQLLSTVIEKNSNTNSFLRWYLNLQ